MNRNLISLSLAVSVSLTSAAWASQSSGALSDSQEPMRVTPWQVSSVLAMPTVARQVAGQDMDLRLLAAAPVKKTAPAHASKKVTAHAAARTTAASASLALGIRNFNRGYVAKAVPFFERATHEQPQNAMAFLWLARAYQKQGSPADFEKAKTAYQKVLTLSPSNQEALSNLGELWSWDPARRADAVTLLQHAYELNPSDPVVARRLSDALFWQGNSMDALRYAAPIANRYRNDRKFMAQYAQMLSSTGHADEALQIYNTVLKDGSGKTAALRVDQARALYKSGQKQAAQAAFASISQSVAGTAMAKDPAFVDSMAGLAFDLELYTDALKWDQNLPESLQRQKSVQLRTARALTHVFRVPEAIDYFNRLYEAGLLNTDEKLEFAEYLRMLHLPPEGLPSPDLIAHLYQEAQREQPDNGSVAVRLARYYGEEDGKFTETVQFYKQALATVSPSDRDAVKKELLDYIKSDKTQPQAVEALFQELLAAEPNDVMTKTAYAEYLSWQPDRRTEAMRMYVELAKADPDHRDLWESRIEEVLKWHQPTTDLIPLYQEIVNVYPQNKAIWMAVARAYRSNKDYYKEAVETYATMVRRYPDDGTIKREWLGMLMSNAAQRGQNIKLLEKMVKDDPSDLDVLATYGRLLSFDHRIGQALSVFNQVLKQNPEHREALIGKGYAILWDGRKYEAQDYFQGLRQRYPDDVDVAVGLASAEKEIGRYDQALKILQEIKPLMQKQPEASDAVELRPDYLLVDNTGRDTSLVGQGIYDFSVLPYADDVQAGVIPTKAAKPVVAPANSSNAQIAAAPPTQPTSAGSTASPEEVQSLRSDIDALTNAVDALKALQASSRSQLDQINRAVTTTKDVASGEMNLQSDSSAVATMGGAGAGSGSGLGLGNATGTGGYRVGEGAMTSEMGTYAAIDYDTNPLLSGLGRFKNDDMITDMERGLRNDLRPMVRGGFLYSKQGGESTTTALHSWGFPNQISLSLTPQVRLRGGFSPAKWYLPNGVSPDSTWGWTYGVGTTIKYWDRLTLDGDIALTHYSQSKSDNLTFQAQAEYAFNDSIKAKLGFRRYPQYNSLLTLTGLRPSLGNFRGDLVGQARENGVYGEINTHPFSQNIDWNLGYEWAFIDGEHIPTNHKNQAFTSLGYTWHYAPNHQVRLGYEFLYFGYGKNATNGYFDVTANGSPNPVVQLRPVVASSPGYVFGGYFSPKWFILNSTRLDVRGSLFNKFLEYKLGGSIGLQDFGVGRGVHDKEAGGFSLASSFDANVIMNLTDWLAGYGNVDFLDAGGQFNRWRFGGGLIVRPSIDALSPVFGPHTAPAAKSAAAAPQ